MLVWLTVTVPIPSTIAVPFDTAGLDPIVPLPRHRSRTLSIPIEQVEDETGDHIGVDDGRQVAEAGHIHPPRGRVNARSDR